jgi:hypothetical protein
MGQRFGAGGWAGAGEMVQANNAAMPANQLVIEVRNLMTPLIRSNNDNTLE